MSVKEKLHALELLWNDLCADEGSIPVTQWHRDLLDKRTRMVKAGQATFSSWESAKKRISARTRGEN
jgi:putative addiction module component (TIGR02574 family)